MYLPDPFTGDDDAHILTVFGYIRILTVYIYMKTDTQALTWLTGRDGPH